MAPRIPQLLRFFYSHYFYGGLRKSVGTLLPVILLGGVFNQYEAGMIAAVGALCVGIIDQPGGPRRFRTNEMLGGIVLGAVTVLITGMASSSPLAIWLVVPALCFFLSMFTVFGRRGGLIGFACLLLMTLTMHTPLPPERVLWYSAYTVAGGAFYFLFSEAISRLMWHREEQQTLSVALFATADYIAARARFYDVHSDLDACYRQLIRTQSDMADKHQTARDMVLRELPKGRAGRGDHLRTVLLNVFVDMVNLLDNMVATHTDYATLRRELPDSDTLLYAQDALLKISLGLGRIALNISRNKKIAQRGNIKAETRAFEYELEIYRKHGLDKDKPEVYALLVQILRRLRNAGRMVEQMTEHMNKPRSTESIDARLDKSLTRFLTRQEVRFGMLTSNLRLDSSHFRYAIRVTIAAVLGLTITAFVARFVAREDATPMIMAHSYWIILTILIVMKPGFALTRQRNGWRLMGTLMGCAVAFALFAMTNNPDLLLAALTVSCIMGNSLIMLNYTLASLFNTLFVLLAYHFLSPSVTLVIGERAADTLIGCTLALLCSYVLPWWEYNFMKPLAQAAKTANQDYLAAGLRYAALNRAHRDSSTENPTPTDGDFQDADAVWRLARKNVLVAFGNFASAFYRMMDEPVAQQRNVPEINVLLIQNHVLASQISASIPILANLERVPPNVGRALDAIQALLANQDATPPASVEIDGDLATLAYPLKQMMRAAQAISQNTRKLGWEPAGAATVNDAGTTVPQPSTR
ncbi:MAG TPA: FUSC family membrane protein [Burkholderiaceae bacterium]|nr:FUSC family membrane protein [Burkholderiaceae bacterium]